MKRLLLTIVLMSGIWSAAQADTLGNTSGTTNLGIAKGAVYNREYTTPSGASLSVSAFHFTFGGTTPVAADTFRVGAYYESGGLPGALIFSAIGTGYTTGGQKDISVSATITSGTKIVLALLLTSGSTSGSHNIGAVTTQVNGCYRGFSFATLPDPYGSCTSTWGLANEYQMWIEYTQSGGGSPAPSTKRIGILKALSALTPYFPLESESQETWKWPS